MKRTKKTKMCNLNRNKKFYQLSYTLDGELSDEKIKTKHSINRILLEIDQEFRTRMTKVIRLIDLCIKRNRLCLIVPTNA